MDNILCIRVCRMDMVGWIIYCVFSMWDGYGRMDNILCIRVCGMDIWYTRCVGYRQSTRCVFA